MKLKFDHTVLFCCTLLLVPASTLASELPAELSGRWTWVERSLSQTFKLEDIKPKGDDAFVAELTWWTIKSECAIRGESVEGSFKDGVLAFSAETKCGTRFDASMKKQGDGWIGSAIAGKVTVEMKAD
ncbi:hypothetical protein [Cognatazoarcus halotolerans]|uniref:hypothetical protein n=1 Tax=Cognatazoarcus halotolerans TaxID=2686016 RepID=UPI00135B2919|nr:hypothetical protein [Cognatazoarcus halotolerans]MCB1900396.1 hypothetical protein [Rhodocyclaceae bacterium]MCP5310154.1 hypothetical protein [Zoogloeaceae bacterium]